MEENGVWRTVGGRRIFIKEGQDLAEAMKESGKFSKQEVSNDKKVDRDTKIKELTKENEKYIEDKDSDFNVHKTEVIKNVQELQVIL